MPYPSILLDNSVLFLEPCHAEYNIVMGNVSDNKVDRMALLHSCAITHSYHLAYNCSSAQRHTIDCDDRQQQFIFSLPPACLSPLQAEPIGHSLRDGVVSCTQVNER
jgi:hypothetical protein